MEDALALYIKTWMPKSMLRLNPCFNGRCTRTDISNLTVYLIPVLILVLMEDALARRDLVKILKKFSLS